MNKDRLRKLFGKFGEVDLESGLEELIKSKGFKVQEMSGYIESSLEKAPHTDCKTNQSTLLSYLNGYINGDVQTTIESLWAVRKHMETCLDAKCERLDIISQFDKRLTPEEMEKSFGNEIREIKGAESDIS